MAFALLWLACGPAHAQTKLTARYALSLADIAIGEGDWAVEITKDRYTAQSSGRFLGIWRVLLGSDISAVTHGTANQGHLVPTSYGANFASDDDIEDVRLTFRDGVVSELETKPTTAAGADRIPVVAAHLHGVLDPLTAGLVVAPKSGDVLAPAACRRTLPIFDGSQRFDMVLSFKRMDNVKAENGYRGPAVVCAMTYRPVAGTRRAPSASTISRKTVTWRCGLRRLPERACSRSSAFRSRPCWEPRCCGPPSSPRRRFDSRMVRRRAARPESAAAMRLHREAERHIGPTPHPIRQYPADARQQGEQERKRDDRPIARETAADQRGGPLGRHLEGLPSRFLLRHRGRNVSRTYDADAYSVRAQQTAQGEAVAQNRRLAGAIARGVGKRNESGKRPHDADLSVAAGHHPRQQRVNRVENPQHVGLDQGMAVIGRLDLAIGRPTRHHARIGDQDIDRRGAIEVFEPPAYLRPGPDVDRRHMRFSAVSSALRSHPVETLAVAAQQPEARPLDGVAQRQRLADSAGCAGDDDHAWHGQSNSMFTVAAEP